MVVDLSTLTDMWHRIVSTQPDPPRALVLVTAALAVAAVLPRRLWRVSRHVVTIAHEGGHALVALAAGRRLSGIRLHSDTSGVTVSVGRTTGPGMVATLLAGYPTPSLLGLLAAGLLASGHITALLWVSIGLLGAMLVLIRNVFGVVSVVVTGGIVLTVSWLAAPATQAAFGYLFTWFLLVGGVRPVFELQTRRRHRQAPHSDADQLAHLTGVFGLAWIGLFATVTVAALLVGAAWLLP